MLSVGGPDGLAHLGAIEALRAANVEISCVVGNSMGSLVGALYASAPSANTTKRFGELIARYNDATRGEVGDSAAGGGLIGLLLAGPFGLLAGAAAGATTVEKVDHERLIRVLDGYLGNARMEQLPVPFRTSHVQKDPNNVKVEFVESETGSVAQAVGDSVANPFIFKEIDVRGGGPIDPGVDRVAAIPIEQACEAFPDRELVAINVTGHGAFVSSGMHCPTFEIAVPPDRSAKDPWTDQAAFNSIVEAGWRATAAWLATPDGRHFLKGARRSQAAAGDSGVYRAPSQPANP